jgi:hypothetical protein
MVDKSYSEAKVLDLCNKAYMRGQEDMKKRCLGVLHADSVDTLSRLMNIFTEHQGAVKRMPDLEIVPMKLKQEVVFDFESLTDVESDPK